MTETVLITGASSGIGQTTAKFIGEDVGDFVKAKREMSEQGYIDFMRFRFAPAKADENRR